MPLCFGWCCQRVFCLLGRIGFELLDSCLRMCCWIVFDLLFGVGIGCLSSYRVGLGRSLGRFFWLERIMCFGRYEIFAGLGPLFGFCQALPFRFGDLGLWTILWGIYWYRESCCFWSLLSVPSSPPLILSARYLCLDSTAPVSCCFVSYFQTWAPTRCCSLLLQTLDCQHHCKYSTADSHCHKPQPSSRTLSFGHHCSYDYDHLHTHCSDKPVASSACWCSGCCSSNSGPLLMRLYFSNQIFADSNEILIQFYFEFLRFGSALMSYLRLCTSIDFGN